VINVKSYENKAFAQIVYAVEEILTATLDYRRRDGLRKARKKLLVAISKKRPRSGQVKAALKA
jgi:hypothetical protein